MSTHKNRKDEHVDLAEKFYEYPSSNDFNALRFVHHSFPETDQSQVSLQTRFASFSFDVPFYINGMTGGSERTYKINQDLATVARETGIAMASGSLSIALKDSSVIDSFAVIRKTNPNGIIFANLGTEHSLESAKKAVDIMSADALQIHVNAPQELIMPEGERSFSSWLENIEQIVSHLEVPVIVKEVGFGMSQETIQQLVDIGVKTIDISGHGGTNFASIENYRRDFQDLAFLESWGQSTAISLLESLPLQSKVEILASGGIKTPLDIIKALALGAKSVGLSGHFLHLILNEGVEKTIIEVEEWKKHLVTIMTLLGKSSVEDLTSTDIILYEPLLSWCHSRGIQWRGR